MAAALAAAPVSAKRRAETTVAPPAKRAAAGGGGPPSTDPHVCEWCYHIADSGLLQLADERVHIAAWFGHLCPGHKCDNAAICVAHGAGSQLQAFLRHACACHAVDCGMQCVLPGRDGNTACALVQRVAAHVLTCKAAAPMERIMCAICTPATAIAMTKMSLLSPGPAAREQLHGVVLKMAARAGVIAVAQSPGMPLTSTVLRVPAL